MTTTLTTNETRMVLQPEILNMREDFRNSLNNRINNISELISIENIDIISTIDSEIIRLRDVWDTSLKKLLDIIEK